MCRSKVSLLPETTHLSLEHWSAQGIYFSASHRTYSHLYRLNPSSRSIELVTAPEQFVGSQFSFSKDFSQIAFVSAGPGDYSEVYVSGTAQFKPKRLTAMGEQIAGFKLAGREVIEWKSKDGTFIEGVLIKPADFDSSKKYHWDVISGVDYLISRGIVDKDRVGAMGWSEGGYISAFITCFSDRFKAVSVGAGISDRMTYYANTDIHPFTRQYLKATPWDDPEIYKKTSPITYVKNARTPTLIQHGELDKRVPIPNGYELYQALKDRGVPVEMVVYKGFGHPINKPKQQRAAMEHNYGWFCHWIWGDKMPDIAVEQ